ncbi:myosin heavy chain kinase [Pelomyxa schiedti]|nr:myosin heavy chain kinase [Pelomyxa schiedti]
MTNLPLSCNVSYVRQKIFEDRLFPFPEGVCQTDLVLGYMKNGSLEKLTPRQSFMDLVPGVKTLILTVEEVKVPRPKDIPGRAFKILEGSERAVKWEYDPTAPPDQQWKQGALIVTIEAKPFAQGSMRLAYVMRDLANPSKKYVAKKYRESVSRESYFVDAKMQTVSGSLAAKYNEKKPPKKVDFLPCYVIELVDQPGEVLYGVEPFVSGAFKKYNNNNGFIAEERNTPQAFSHFTYEESGRKYMVVDIQGVDDMYTDPQIHTVGDDLGSLGRGNCGQSGIDKFLHSHQCNAICQYLQLSSINPKKPGQGGTVPRPQDLLKGLWDNFPKGAEEVSPATDVSTAATPVPSSPVPAITPTQPLSPNSTAQAVAVPPSPTPVTPVIAVRPPTPSTSPPPQILTSPVTPPQSPPTEKANTESIAPSSGLPSSSPLPPRHGRCVSDTESGVFQRAAVDAGMQPAQPWVAQNLRCQANLSGNRDSVSTLCVGSGKIFCGTSAGIVRVWDFETQQPLRGDGKMKPQHAKRVEGLCCNENQLISGSSDQTIKVWDLRTLMPEYILEEHTRPVFAVDCRDNILFSGSGDKMLKMWDLRTRSCLQTVECHSRAVRAISCSNTFVFTGSNDNSIKVWNTMSKLDCAYTFTGHTKWVKKLAIAGQYLFSASYDQTVRVWNLRELSCTAVLQGHEDFIDDICIGNNFLFSGSNDNTIRVWDVVTHKPVHKFRAHDGGVSALAFYNGVLLSGSYDYSIKLWKTD